MALALLLPAALLFVRTWQPSLHDCLAATSPLEHHRCTVSLKMAPRKLKKRKPKKVRPAATPSSAAVASRPAAPQPPVSTEAAERDAHMAAVRGAIERSAPALLDGLASRGFAIVDGFLPTTTVLTMRAECESLRAADRMEV